MRNSGNMDTLGKTGDHDKLNCTFAGCGFMGIYHIGVASCIREYAPSLFQDKIGGASAGAIVACLVICDAPLGFCTSWTLRLAASARKRSLGPMHPSFNITSYLQNGLEEILPHNAHTLCSGRLHISMTRVRDWQNIIVNHFVSREELIQALLCSAFIPLWSGLVPPMFRNERCIDGALSNNLPQLDRNTITVSPFAGKSDICPQDDSLNTLYLFLSNTSVQFSVRNLYRISRIMFPPHPEKLSEFCKQGFEDALAYLQRNDLVNCSRHLAVQSVLSRRVDSVCRDLNLADKDATDETDGSQHHCESCLHNKKRQPILPQAVVSALDEAVELVNANYLIYLKNHRTYRTLSVMFSPLYLPFDIVVNVMRRLLRWLPFMHKDIIWLVKIASWYLKLLSGSVVTKGQWTYTAKFMCQFAITEVQHVDFMTDIVESQVITSQTRIHDSCIGIEHSVSNTDTLGLIHEIRQKYLESQLPERLEIDMQTMAGNSHTLMCPSRRGSVSVSVCSSKSASRAVSRAASRGVSRRASVSEGSVKGSDICSQYLDTYDSYLRVADQRDAVLAYYYKDEYGCIKATEIFSLGTGSPNQEETTVLAKAEAVQAITKCEQQGSAKYSFADELVSDEVFDLNDSPIISENSDTESMETNEYTPRTFTHLLSPSQPTTEMSWDDYTELYNST